MMITKIEMITELNRELALRKAFYARQIRNGQIEKDLANKYWNRMYGAMIFIKTGNVLVKGLTLKDMAVELRREQYLRKDFYRKLIDSGQMKKQKANRQYLHMQAALDYIVACDEKNKGKQKTLFADSKTYKNYEN